MSKTTNTKKTTSKKNKPVDETVAIAEPIQTPESTQAETIVIEEKKEVVEVKPISRKVFTPDTEVEVASNTAGRLVYVSKKTSERFEWTRLDDTNWMTIDELTTMRNTQRGFFENNWVKIVGEDADEIIKYLRLDKYYENFVDMSDLRSILTLNRDEIVDKVSGLKTEIKDAIASAAKQAITDGELADLTAIRALEKAIGYALLEN